MLQQARSMAALGDGTERPRNVASVMAVGLLGSVIFGAICPRAEAWVYPEHRDLAVLAVQHLDPDRAAIFERLWSQARTGAEQRLCTVGADSVQGLAPQCLDWPAWTAIAGDHSCSSAQMLATVREAPWILPVADVAAKLKVDLARASGTVTPHADNPGGISAARRRFEAESVRAARINALRAADLRLQRTDPEYATRAGANNAHFLLARPATNIMPADYAALTLRPGSEISAIGVYSYFHLSALQKASRLSQETLAPEEREALARAVLADEAFALHFLEDVYAAGHIAGTWGDVSQRQGTHDYYNENGLEVFTWNGGAHSIVVMGDAHMRPEDAEVGATAVRHSLEQVLDVAAGRESRMPLAPQAPATPESFDVCRSGTLPTRSDDLRALPEHRLLLAEILAYTPVPSLGPGVGSMPRFRSEIGPFVGLSGAIDGRRINGGLLAFQDRAGWVGGLDLSVRAGFGLDGVTGQAGDGLVYAAVGLRSDTPSSSSYTESSTVSSGNLTAAIPARSSLSVRLRMPFYLVPFDLLLLSPLYLARPETYMKLAVAAGNGGFVPWQAGWANGLGRFQIVIGREVGFTFYGLRGKDELIAPGDTPGTLRLVGVHSTSIDLPVLEYRPYRAFSANQSSAVLVQLFTGLDIPRGGEVVVPAGDPSVPLHNVWSVGLRLVFDWRYYF
jgi:hypothetical protein